MSDTEPLSVAIVGCGKKALHHARWLLKRPESARVRVVCEPVAASYARLCQLYVEAGVEPPPNQPDLARMLAEHGHELDVAIIITPHAFHHEQAKHCLQAGLDVLLEKPMVMSVAEAESLIEVRDRSGGLLVVSFDGALSPQTRKAAAMLRAGELGQILNIHGVFWQGWKVGTTGTWRQKPELSGGGFLFDSGAHLLNTTIYLAGEEFVEVAAWVDNRNTAVDIVATVTARLASGGMVALTACGDTIKSCASDIRVFCTEGIVLTDAWGQRLQIQRAGETEPVAIDGVWPRDIWREFLDIRRGHVANPSPPEVGLRLARVWEGIQRSAAAGGAPVPVGG